VNYTKLLEMNSFLLDITLLEVSKTQDLSNKSWDSKQVKRKLFYLIKKMW
jgi:hypothetical protein